LITQVEGEQLATTGVVREPVGMATDCHLRKQRIIRGAKDARSCAASIRGEQEVVLVVDENTSYPRVIPQGAQIAVRLAVNDVNSIGACMCNVDPLMGVTVIVYVSVVESCARAWRDGNGSLSFQRHSYSAFVWV
jgi:hypothetical protein